jgi:hypothetical protein
MTGDMNAEAKPRNNYKLDSGYFHPKPYSFIIPGEGTELDNDSCIHGVPYRYACEICDDPMNNDYLLDYKDNGIYGSEVIKVGRRTKPR